MEQLNWQGYAHDWSGAEVITRVTCTPVGNGSVRIELPSDVAEASSRHYSTADADVHTASIHVPLDALKAFVIRLMMKDFIRQMEDEDNQTVLGLAVASLLAALEVDAIPNKEKS